MTSVGWGSESQYYTYHYQNNNNGYKGEDQLLAELLHSTAAGAGGAAGQPAAGRGEPVYTRETGAYQAETPAMREGEEQHAQYTLIPAQHHFVSNTGEEPREHHPLCESVKSWDLGASASKSRSYMRSLQVSPKSAWWSSLVLVSPGLACGVCK